MVLIPWELLVFYIRMSHCDLKYKHQRWLVAFHKPCTISPTTVPQISVSAFKKYTVEQSCKALKWHRRFGHVGMRVVKKLLRKEMTTGLPEQIENEPFNCSDFLLSKSLRHQTLGPSGRSRPQPLELIVSEIAGPFEAGPFGFKYMITFQDVATNFTNAIVLRSQEQAPGVFKEFVMKMEHQTSKKIKTMRTDGAGEFTLASFLAWLASQGITKEKPMPYEHSQNGIEERSTRTIGDMGRTMFISSKLPRHLWHFAYLTAAFLHNHIPNVHTGDKTPFKILTGHKPNLEGLNRFGEEAYVHIPSER